MARRVHSSLASFVRKSGPPRSDVEAVGIPRGGRTPRAASGAFAAGRRGAKDRRAQNTPGNQERDPPSGIFVSHIGGGREFVWRADVAIVALPGLELDGNRTEYAREYRA